MYCRLVSQVTDTGTAGFSGTKEQNVFQMTFFGQDIKLNNCLVAQVQGSFAFCYLIEWKVEVAKRYADERSVANAARRCC